MGWLFYMSFGLSNFCEILVGINFYLLFFKCLDFFGNYYVCLVFFLEWFIICDLFMWLVKIREILYVFFIYIVYNKVFMLFDVLIVLLWGYDWIIFLKNFFRNGVF